MTNLKTHFELHFKPQNFVLYEEYNGKYYRKKWEEIVNCKGIKRIHYNTTKWKHYIIIDVDNDNLYRYKENNLPEPNFILKNKTKEGGHLFYVLSKGVYFENEYYLNMWKVLQKTYTYLGGGDPLNKGYVGKFINSNHFEYIELNPYSYDINYLYSKINYTQVNNQSYSPVDVDYTYKYKNKLTNKKSSINAIKHNYLIQVGERNNTLFEKTRKFAYVQVIKLSKSDFKIAVKNYINKLNNSLLIKLQESEIKATANSIIKYCIKNKTKIENYNNKNKKNRGIMKLSDTDKSLKEKQKLSAAYATQIKVKKTIFKLRLSIIEMKARKLNINVSTLSKYSKISRKTIYKYKDKLNFS